MLNATEKSGSSFAANCWFLTGATATGKTTIGIRLAKRLNAEIVSLDSMAIYRGMDIGTAKPTREQQKEAPHHQIDIRDPNEEYSVAQYVADASRLVEEIQGRGREVLFVGGTPLYLKALLRGFDKGPGADPAFRDTAAEEAREIGADALYERVQQIDPVAAAAIHPNDTRRLIRVLEFFKQTGRPISHHQIQFEEGLPAGACRVFVLRRERDLLHQRIAKRVNEMFASGLVDEVRALTSGDAQLGKTASQAVGYREVQDFLAGAIDESEAIEKTLVRTRRFAKRQETWFRSLRECRFIDLPEKSDHDATAAQIADAGKSVQ